MNAPKSVEREAVEPALVRWASARKAVLIYIDNGDASAFAKAWRELGEAEWALLALSGPVSGMDTSSVAGVHCEQAGSHTGGLTPLERELLEALKDTVDSLEFTLRPRFDGWECSEETLLGKPRAAIAKAEATATEAQHSAGDTIEINGRTYRRFIPHPQVVDDGTVRCIFCGQIDDEPWHDMKLCLDRPAPEMAKRPSPPPAAPPSPAPPSSEREGSRAEDRS